MAKLLRILESWRGFVVGIPVLALTTWLAATDQLTFYIHPRYELFTIVMCVIGWLFVGASVLNSWLAPSRKSLPGDADTAHSHEPVVSTTRWGKAAQGSSFVLSVVVALAIVAVPSATLTSATASQRAINSTGAGDSVRAVTAESETSAGASVKFTVRDWASLLGQTTERAFYQAKPADVVGFVTPDSDDPENVFYVSRFVVTCCAVDAQPVGVPVYLVNWPESFASDDWVRVQGLFAPNPSRTSKQPLTINSPKVVTVDEPAEPYIF